MKDFGAKGDGTTDDYDALLAAAKAINDNGGGALYFPPGIYNIDRYIIDGPNKNGVTSIVFRNCNNLDIVGNNAVINVKGSFHRTSDYMDASGRYRYSYSKCVQPFAFVNCSNFRLEGFEIDGNVDEMTRDSGVAESPGSGVFTQNCSNYIIRDIYVHHFQTDGIYLGFGPTKADRNALLENVVASHNARQGLSVIQLRGGTFLNCTFEETGNASGSYGGHWPKGGADVEPNRDVPDVDLKTGDLDFINCTFRENRGDQFLSVFGTKVENIRLTGCKFIQGDNGYTYGVRLAISNGIIEDSLLDVSRIDLSWAGAQSSSIMRDNRIASSAIVKYDPSASVSLENNELF